MKRVLVTGHTGMLGSAIVQRFQQQYNGSLFGVSRTKKISYGTIQEYQVDLTDTTAVTHILSEVKPDLIIHTAALTNLQYCETHKNETYQLHVQLSRLLAEHKAAKTIYISTDSVFDGETSSSFSESDPTYPLNYYAMSKLEGEWAMKVANPETLIIRTNIYGFKKPEGNSLAEWGLKSLKEGKTISGYSDVFFNPLYVGQLADLIFKLADTSLSGPLHVGTSENISKFGFLKELARIFEYPEALVQDSHAPQNDVLRRPKNTSLNISYLKKVLNENPSLFSGLNMFKSDYLKSHEVN